MRESGRQQGYRVNDNDYQIPGTYSTSVGNSSSMVDPSKQTYGATSAENTTGKSYTTSGSNKHIRNVSVGGAADYPSTSEHQPMYQNRTEYQYNTDSSIPRTANKEEGDFQTQDEPTMVKKISETIKSTLYWSSIYAVTTLKKQTINNQTWFSLLLLIFDLYGKPSSC